MTLVLGVHSRDHLWIVVDRRLSYGRHRPPKDNAVKVMCLETPDGVGLLAYAGLGATLRGTEPSAWMAAILRGRGGLTFEQALGFVSDAANKELPRHLARIPGGAHFIIVPAFISGVGARLYTIDNLIDPGTGRLWYRYTSHQRTAEPGSPSVQLVLGGTGGLCLAQDRTWQRPLRRLLKAHDRGRVSDHAVADQLARLNYQAHRSVRDESVGPSCIVVWRRRRDARLGGPGGAHQFYTRTERDAASEAIPTIGNGLDVQAIGGLLLAQMQAHITRHGFSFETPFEINPDEMNRQLAEIPSDPDEKLR